MKRLFPILSLFLCLVLVPSVKAQFTTVSATVVDPNSVPYANCHVSASYVPSPTATTQALIAGSTFQTVVPAFQCDSFGHFSVTLVDNTQVSDGHSGGQTSKWSFSITSGPGYVAGPYSFTYTAVISGTTMDISAALKAVAAPFPALSSSFSGITSGTNTSAAMVVGTGASLTTSGSGTITANGAPFSGLTGGTNTTAAMLVGTGASLGPTGSGTLTATTMPWSGLTSFPSGCTNQVITAILLAPTCTSLTTAFLPTTGTWAFGGTLSGNYAETGTVTSSSFNGIISVDGVTYSCTTGWNAALTAAAAGSGTVNASACTGSITITTTVNMPSVQLLLGKAAITLNGCPGINITAQRAWAIRGPTPEAYSTGASTAHLISGAACPLIASTSSLNPGDGGELRDIELDGNSKTGTYGYYAAFGSRQRIIGLYVHDFATKGMYFAQGLNSMRDSMVTNNSGDGVFWGPDSSISGYTNILTNTLVGLHVWSGGTQISGLDSDFNGAQGVYFDGTGQGDWASTHSYNVGTIITPSVNNAGLSAFEVASVTGGATCSGIPCATNSSSEPNWGTTCSTSNSTCTDGAVTWQNKGAAQSSFNVINGGYIDDNGTDNILAQGYSTTNRNCYQNRLNGVYTSQASTSGLGADAIHFKFCTGDIVAGGTHLGGAGGQQLDTAGIVIESSDHIQVTGWGSKQTTKLAINLLTANDVMLSAIEIYDNGITGGSTANSYGLTIDSNSNRVHVDNLYIHSDNSFSRGINNAGAGTIIGAYSSTGLLSTPDVFGFPIGWNIDGSNSRVNSFNGFEWMNGSLVNVGSLDTSGHVNAQGFLPLVAGAADAGSTSLPLGNLWLGTAATNNFKFAPAVTSAQRIVTLNDPGAAVNLPFTSNSDTTTTHVLHATATGNVFTSSAIATGDLPTAIPIGNIGTSGLSGTAPVTISAAGAIGCATCVTSAAALTSNAVVIGGGGQASSTISADTTTTHALFATGTSPAFRALATGDMPATVVQTGQVNTGAAAMTLNIAASTTANSFVVPAQAGLTSGTNGAIAYDTTNNNTHIRTNAADSIAVAEAAALAANVIPKQTDATHGLVAASLASDNGTALTYTGTGGVLSSGNNAILTTDFTDTSSASLQNVTGLNFTLPANTARNYEIDCNLMWSQATFSGITDQFGLQDVTVAPTRIDGYGLMSVAGPGAVITNAIYGVLTNLATTTATAIVSAIPTVATINFAQLHFTVQQPSNASTSVLQIMVSQSTAADVIVVRAGSSCRLN